MYSLNFLHLVGRIAICTSDGRYLSNSGQLVEARPAITKDVQCLFALEVRAAGAQSGCLLKDVDGTYLSVTGTQHTIRSGKTNIATKEEVFLVESSVAQVAFKSTITGKYLSCKQGTEMYYLGCSKMY